MSASIYDSFIFESFVALFVPRKILILIETTYSVKKMLVKLGIRFTIKSRRNVSSLYSTKIPIPLALCLALTLLAHALLSPNQKRYTATGVVQFYIPSSWYKDLVWPRSK